jgi:photosystem II stability/assembly factor-like uncharacterized protein
MRFALLLFFVLDCVISFSQLVEIITYQEGKIHARGIEFSNKSLYLACNNGMLYRYDLNNKKTYILNPVEEAPELRDVAHNKSHVLTMQRGKEGLVIWTDQFGNRTTSCYLKDEKGPVLKEVFWDGIAIEKKLGFLMGDPIEGFFTLYFSTNAGEDWKPCFGKIKAFEGEAGFAASGSTVQIQDGVFYFVSGGLKSRFHTSNNKGKTWKSYEIPFESKESAGPFSLAIKDKLNMCVVGGDFEKANSKENNCFISNDGGKTWEKCVTPPNGYRSCVIFTDGVYYACGTNGMDFSTDNGLNWQKINDLNTFSMAFDEKFIYVTSTQGKVLKIKKIK